MNTVRIEWLQLGIGQLVDRAGPNIPSSILAVIPSFAVNSQPTPAADRPAAPGTADDLPTHARIYALDGAVLVAWGPDPAASEFNGLRIEPGAAAWVTLSVGDRLSFIATTPALPLPVAWQASDDHLGQVGGHIALASASFSRPADTSAYAAGDLVANSTPAAQVLPMTFAVARSADKGFMVRRAHIKKSSTSLANASFRLHLYGRSPLPSNGDNGAWLTDEKDYLGAMDVTMDKVFTDAVKGNAVPNVGSEISSVPDSGTVNIYGLLEARAAYAPGNAETFTVTLEVLQD